MTAPDLGPLPEPKHRGPAGTGNYFDAWTADQLRAERQRCYDMGVAAERERQPEPQQPCALTWAIQRLNSTPYAMTKDECVEMLRGLRSEIQALARPNPQLTGRS